MVKSLNNRSKTDLWREEILRAAARVVAEKGAEAAGLEEIARRLDRTKASVYYYFRSKEEILRIVQRRSLERFLRVADRLRRRRLPPDLALHLLIQAQIRVMLEDGAPAAGHLALGGRETGPWRKIVRMRDAYESRIRNWIREGMDRGAFAAGDAKLAALAILGAVNWTVRWYRAGGALSPAEIGRAFADLLVRGLLAPRRILRRPAAGLLDRVMA